MELDLLGDLLTSALKYREVHFDGSVLLHDETTQSELRADEMFTKQGERYFMRQESVPGDLAIKAIAVDKDGIYLETSPLNKNEIPSVIVDEMIPISFIPEDCLFCDIHTQKALIVVSKPKKPGNGLGMRCLMSISLIDLSPKQQQISVEMLDLLYTRGCFIVEEEYSTSTPTSQRMVQRLELGLQQRLSAEQRPLLSLSFSDTVETGVAVGTELLMLFSLEQRILRMEGEELLNFIIEYIGIHGEERIKNVLLFTIAGKIKRTVPKLTWKEARRLAKEITAKQKVA